MSNDNNSKNNNAVIKACMNLERKDLPIKINFYDREYILKPTKSNKLILNKFEMPENREPSSYNDT